MSASRSFRRGLAALVVLAPVALWTASGNAWLDLRAKRAVVETVAAVGATGDYGGSDWRIDRVETFTGQAPGANAALNAQDLPAGTRLVRVRLALRAKDEAAVKALSRCSVSLVDAHARRWNATVVQPGLRRDVPTRCDGSYNNSPQVAQEFRFEQDFLVPDDAADSIDAVVRLTDAKPRVLRLRLR